MDRKWWTLLVACAATFMLLLDVTIVSVALPEIQSGLHSSYSQLQWVVDAYALTLAALLLTSGALADRYGRRRLTVIGLAIFTLGSLLCGLAQSSLMLIVSRGGQGVGGAVLFATSLALLAQSFHGRERGVAFAAWGTVAGAASALGPILAGAITTGLSWRAIFLVNLPIGIAAIVATEWRVDESRASHAHRPDWAGFLSLTAGLISLIYGLIRAGETSFSDTTVIVCLALAAGLLATFVLVERRGAHPMFDLSLFRTPTFGGGLVAAFAMNGSLFAMLVYLVLYLQDDLGYSALGTGVRLALITAATMLSALIAGKLSTRLPVRWSIGSGLALVGAGLLLMSGLHGASSWTHLIPGFIIAGIGAGLVNPSLAATAVSVVTPDRAGMASGANTTLRQIGIATSIAVFGSIFAAALHHHLDRALANIPPLAGTGSQVAAAIRRGDAAHAINTAPPGARAALVSAIHGSFASAMNELLLISGLLALVGAACSLALIRGRDFVDVRPYAHTDPGKAAGKPNVTHTSKRPARAVVEQG